MAVDVNIDKYINNSKLRGQLCRWKKALVYVYVTPITAPVDNKAFLYSQIDKAVNSWNEIFKSNGIQLKFEIINNPAQADITVHWVKVGRVYEGMCKYLSIIGNEIKKISIEIGLQNEFSGKTITDLSIYCAIMHEFGHSVGLGHGINPDDIMFVPHQKNISVPSDNDLYVLKELYR